ncbi:ATP-binding protein [Geodermatophilus sp. SYSU D00703]
MRAAPWQQQPPPDLGPGVTTLGRWSPASIAQLTAGRLQLGAALHDGSRPARADETAVQELVLVFEELVSNALRHGRPPVTVSVTADDRSWLLQVSDAAGDRPPAAVDRDPGRGGLGLGLVAEMSVNHGWRVDVDGGKTVWARVAFRHPAAAEQDTTASS